jgi:uncharacterized protein YnzC (UPF0291/DUF896 family)
MRKSKYDEVIPSQPISEKEKQSSEIDKRIELSSEIINLNQQIDSIKKLSKDLKVLGTLAINAIDANEKSLKALNAAMKSSDNIVNGICNAITRAENTTITVVLSPKEKSELANYRKALIEEERKLMGNHLQEMKVLLESHQQAIRKYLKSESGFFLTGWISKYSLIAFWVLYAYFCLSLCLWIFCRI